jgi:hypothetical protein
VFWVIVIALQFSVLISGTSVYQWAQFEIFSPKLILLTPLNKTRDGSNWLAFRGGPVEISPGLPTILTAIFFFFFFFFFLYYYYYLTLSLKATAGILSTIKPRLLPSTSFPINPSITMLQLDGIQNELQPASLHEP